MLLSNMNKRALNHLLLHVRSKIRSLPKAKKRHKRRWLLKKACNNFKINPYKTGKSLLDPYCFVSLKVDQANLDQHKASCLNDVMIYPELEGLSPQPQIIKIFKKGCFCVDDFLKSLSSRGNASAPGLNGNPY